MLFHEINLDRSKPAWQLSFQEFIGPVVISPVFDFTIEHEGYEYIWEIQDEGLEDLRIVGEVGSGFLVRELEEDEGAGYVLTHRHPSGEKVIGCYLRGMLWIEQRWRGRGFGSDLVVIASEDYGNSPVGNRGGMGFTEGGYRAHERAHMKIIKRALLRGEEVPDDLRELVAEHDMDEVEPETPSP